MAKKLRTLLMLMALSASVSASEKTCANFLKLGAGARPMGMGGAFVAVADDANTIWWNPAGIAGLKYKEITLMHNEMGENISHQYMAYSHPVKKLGGNLGGSISYLRVDDIQGYTTGGAPNGKLKTYDMGIALSYGLRLTDRALLGLNTKFIKEKLYKYEAQTYAFDFGGLWLTPFEGLRFGFSMRNAGRGLKFINERDPLPLNYALGGAWEFRLFGNRSILSFDFNNPSDYDSYFNAGMEYKIYDLISLRFGYKSKDDMGNNVRLGMGLGGKNLLIDYAWMPRGDFDNSHRISATLFFGPEYKESEIEKNIKSHFELGKKYFYAGHFLKAYREFKNILLVAPRHKGARDFLGRIEVRIEEAEVAKDIARFFTLGEKYYKEGNLTSARAAFEEIITLNPENKEARAYIKKIDGRFKEVVDSILAKGITCYEKTDYDKALIEIQKVLALDSGHEKAFEYMSLIQGKRKELEKIRLALKKKQEKEIKNRKIAGYLKKGLLYNKKKKWSDGIKYFKRILELEPANETAVENIAICYYERALEFYKKDRILEAIADFKNVIKFNPEHKEVREYISGTEEKMLKKAEEYKNKGLKEYAKGNLKEAVKAWEQALRYNPELEVARQNLERARKELKKK